MGRLENKVAIVTGGTQGIGKGIARCFVREGAQVVITSRTAAVGAKAETDIRSVAASGGGVRYIKSDVGQKAQIKGVVNETIKEFGRIDVLVNNAQSVPPYVGLERKPDEHYQQALDSGFYATLWAMQAAFPAMRERGGSIINMCSYIGMVGARYTSDYSAAKEAIRAISRSAANEWGRYAIRVNVISPLAATEGVAMWKEAMPDAFRGVEQAIPLCHFGDPEQDIGGLALGLATDDSRFITGQTICASGGNTWLAKALFENQVSPEWQIE